MGPLNLHSTTTDLRINYKGFTRFHCIKAAARDVCVMRNTNISTQTLEDGPIVLLINQKLQKMIFCLSSSPAAFLLGIPPPPSSRQPFCSRPGLIGC